MAEVKKIDPCFMSCWQWRKKLSSLCLHRARHLHADDRPKGRTGNHAEHRLDRCLRIDDLRVAWASVILDFDLARACGDTTGAFSQQVNKNIGKFPERYHFRLAKGETDSLWSKNLILNKNCSKRGMRFKYLPYAFTEQGAYMLMTVLKGVFWYDKARP